MHATGAPIMLFSLLERLAQTHKVSVLIPSTPDPAFMEGYRAVGVELLTGADLKAFDVFLVNTLLGSWHVLSARGKIPTVWWIHEGAFARELITSGRTDVAAFPAATRVLFPSLWQAREIYRRWLRNADWGVVPTAIPPVVGVRRRRVDDGRFRVLQIGTVERRKGQDLTIKALWQLDDKRVEARFVGYDRIPWALKLKRELEAQPPIPGGINWLGILPPEEALQEIADADVVVLPSRDEAFPLVILEAISLGVPIICSDYGAIAEALVDGEEALLVPPGDPEALARAIGRLQEQPDLAARLARTAQERVLATRSYDHFVTAMEGELRAAIDLFRRQVRPSR